MAQVALLKKLVAINEITKTATEETHLIFILDYKERNDLKTHTLYKFEEHEYYREFLINVASDRIEPQLKDFIVFNNHKFKILSTERTFGKLFKVICGYD
jgi:hypothetical protein